MTQRERNTSILKEIEELKREKYKRQSEVNLLETELKKLRTEMQTQANGTLDTIYEYHLKSIKESQEYTERHVARIEQTRFKKPSELQFYWRALKSIFTTRINITINKDKS